MGSCQTLSRFSQPHLLLDRLSPLSGYLPVSCAFVRRNWLPCFNERAYKIYIYIYVSARRVCLHVATLLSVEIAPMCASASPVLHCFHIPYTLRLLQRDPDQTKHTAQSAQRLLLSFIANWRHLPDQI